jgi:MinD superfamily P-loop ATPase
MKIAVLSGKGGTGKTLVSVNLATAAKRSMYIDCDVEEPNGHLFFKPENVTEEEVSIIIPAVCEELCVGCRKCVDFCKFNALAFIRSKPYVFEEVCHSCGGCILFCPRDALSEKKKVVGKIQKGESEGVSVVTGIMNTGEASGIPIIKKLLKEHGTDAEQPVFIDCPPGSACIVMESLKDADYCVLVAEPTVFGVHNLNMVYELVKLFNKPCGVVLNKCLEDNNPAEQFCIDRGIKILTKIQFDIELGALNSNALIVSRVSDKYGELFTFLLREIEKEAAG